MTEDVAVPTAGGAPLRAPRSSQVRQWGSLHDLSSPTSWENALATRPFQRMPWLAVGLLAGILLWFGLNSPWQWIVSIGICGLIGSAAAIMLPPAHYPFVRGAITSMALVVAAGVVLIWVRSEMVGARPIGRPFSGTVVFRVLERDNPVRDEDRLRILVATESATGSPIRAWLTVPEEHDIDDLLVGTTARARVRLVPPSRAIVPGAYDPARRAWFEGVSAGGTVMSDVEVLGAVSERNEANLRQRLASEIRQKVEREGIDPSAAAIVTTLLTGSRAGIAPQDAQAMRDAGLAHLLSISGLHVGAVIAIIWFVAMRTLALWPWLALRLPLPIFASVLAAMGGMGYTLLTGAALPTIRACLAAMLVLSAMTLGRQALSMRVIAIAAIAVLLFWPEAAISPSFQLSFAAVTAIVTLHNTEPIERFRERMRGARSMKRFLAWAGLLFLTGLVIELTLLPLVLFHFHRSGLYGAAVNLVAIPLTTFAILPILMLATIFDAAGQGGFFWWIGGSGIEFMLSLAKGVSGSPGAVRFVPFIPQWIVVCAAAGGLWLAIWSGRARLFGLIPIGAALISLALIGAPDLMVGGEARHVVLRGADGSTYVLKDSESYEARQLLELSGIAPDEKAALVKTIAQWPGAQCNDDFCSLFAGPVKDPVSLLIARNDRRPNARALAKACAQSELVIAQRPLGPECKPKWMLLDGRELARRGGAQIDLSSRTIRHVRPAGDGHGW